jgi:hypothetical protein
MAVDTPVSKMQARAISALYDAEPVGGIFADNLIPLISATHNDKRSWAVLLDLCESERVIQDSPANGSRYRLSPGELDAEFMRRFAEHRPKVKYDEDWRNA